jgi:hypothetical protein
LQQVIVVAAGGHHGQLDFVRGFTRFFAAGPCPPQLEHPHLIRSASTRRYSAFASVDLPADGLARAPADFDSN